MKSILILIFTSVLMFSCTITGEPGNGNIESKEIPINDFNSINLLRNADLIYEQKAGDSASLKVEIDENLMPFLDIKVENGCLVVSTTKDINSTYFTVYANSAVLKEVKMSGAGDVTLKGNINSDRLSVSASGAGNLYAENLYCDDVNVSLSGAGNIILAGNAYQTRLNVGGAGSIKASGLSSVKTYSQLSGMGSIRLNVSDSLDARVSGMGSIVYKGNPSYKNTSVSGLGSIKPE